MKSNIVAHLNPEIARNLRLTLPPRRALFIAALVVVLTLIGIGFSVNHFIDKYHAHQASIQRIKREKVEGIKIGQVEAKYSLRKERLSSSGESLDTIKKPESYEIAKVRSEITNAEVSAVNLTDKEIRESKALYSYSDEDEIIEAYHEPMQTFVAHRTGAQVFDVLMLVLFGLLFAVAPAMAAMSFGLERMRGTAIFQQMTLLSPFRLALGKYVGSALFAWFIAALLLPFSLVAFAFSDERGKLAFIFYSLLFVGGLSLHAVGLFISSLGASAEKRFRGELLIAPVVGVFGAVSALLIASWLTRDVAISFDRVANNGLNMTTDYAAFTLCSFYGVKVWALFIVLGLLAFIGAWAFAGAVRRVKISQLIPVSPAPVWIFIASAEIVLTGLLWGWREFYNPPVARLITLSLFELGGVACARRKFRLEPRTSARMVERKRRRFDRLSATRNPPHARNLRRRARRIRHRLGCFVDEFLRRTKSLK